MKQYLTTIITTIFICGGITSIGMGLSNDSKIWIVTGTISLLIGMIVVVVVVKTRFLDK